MINDGRKYNFNEYRREQSRRSGRGQRSVRRLQKLFVTLSVTAGVLTLVLAGVLLARLANRKAGDPLFRIGKTTAVSTSETGATDFVLTSETEETKKKIVIRESLPSDPLAESYWGALEEAEDPLPHEHFPVKGLYLNAAVNLEENIELCKRSELNTLVIDLKESDGIYFDTKNETALAVGPGYVRPVLDLPAICAQCHENDIRVIARIVCFKDPMYVKYYPDRAICDSAGNPLYFNNEGGNAFASPYDTRNWEFYISLAKEAIDMGVDEIQFDYVRFPTGSSTTGATPYYGIENEVPARTSAVNRFLQTARIEIQDKLGVPLSADIFGIVVTSSYDGTTLGQDWSLVGMTGVDSVCPMLYPSHYAFGTMMSGNTFDYPDKYPYDVVYNALAVSAVHHKRHGYATVRPYLQAFTAEYLGKDHYTVYDYDAINDEIRALQDSGLEEFILWNATCVYPDGNYGGNNG